MNCKIWEIKLSITCLGFETFPFNRNNLFRLEESNMEICKQQKLLEGTQESLKELCTGIAHVNNLISKNLYKKRNSMKKHTWIYRNKLHMKHWRFAKISYDSYLMQDHWFVGKINKWLWDTECQWPQPSTETSNQNKSLHCEMPVYPIR